MQKIAKKVVQNMSKAVANVTAFVVFKQNLNCVGLRFFEKLPQKAETVFITLSKCNFNSFFNLI